MAGGQRLISWLHPCSTSNVAINMHTCAHEPLMGHPNWPGCDNWREGQAGLGLLVVPWSEARSQCQNWVVNVAAPTTVPAC
jgi:hypothetical protein